jgi:hypothetical protein
MKIRMTGQAPELVTASEIARRIKRSRRGVSLAITRLRIHPLAILDGDRKVYDPDVIPKIKENMRARKGGKR